MCPKIHPLVSFVYQRLGQQFGDLLLAGYNELPSRTMKQFTYNETEDGIEIEWVIELIADTMPCYDEPLVLAALLKLLLSRPDLLTSLDFQTGELIAELKWRNSPHTSKRIDQIISSYVKLTYDKHERRRKDRYKRKGTQWGDYHLLTGYVREAVLKVGESLPISTYNNVSFNNSFIDGLKNGQVRFAGINFGPLS